MKRILALILCLSLALCSLTGCASKTNALAEAYEIFSMKASDLGKVEIIDQSAMTLKTVDKSADVKKILSLLQNVEQLEGITPDLTALESSFVLQFYPPEDGPQLITIGYAEKEDKACLFVAGAPYAIDPIDFAKLWEQLNYETVPAAVQNIYNLDYLEMTDQPLLERYGGDAVLGYIGAMTARRASVDVVTREADSASAAGYVISGAGDGNETYRIADSCEYWVLEDHWYVACRVSLTDLQQYMAETGYAMLWTLYVQNDEVVAIEETYLP